RRPVQPRWPSPDSVHRLPPPRRAVPGPDLGRDPARGSGKVAANPSQSALGRGILGAMSEITVILKAIDAGDPAPAAQPLPLGYEELGGPAAQRLVNEKPGQTLQATALVHEAFLRLVGDQRFDGRGHFFAAAAEAMRRILVEKARQKKRVRHGGDRQRIN